MAASIRTNSPNLTVCSPDFVVYLYSSASLSMNNCLKSFMLFSITDSTESEDELRIFALSTASTVTEPVVAVTVEAVVLLIHALVSLEIRLLARIPPAAAPSAPNSAEPPSLSPSLCSASYRIAPLIWLELTSLPTTASIRLTRASSSASPFSAARQTIPDSSRRNHNSPGTKVSTVNAPSNVTSARPKAASNAA